MLAFLKFTALMKLIYFQSLSVERLPLPSFDLHAIHFIWRSNSNKNIRNDSIAVTFHLRVTYENNLRRWVVLCYLGYESCSPLFDTSHYFIPKFSALVSVPRFIQIRAPSVGWLQIYALIKRDILKTQSSNLRKKCAVTGWAISKWAILKNVFLAYYSWHCQHDTS